MHPDGVHTFAAILSGNHEASLLTKKQEIDFFLSSFFMGNTSSWLDLTHTSQTVGELGSLLLQ